MNINNIRRICKGAMYKQESMSKHTSFKVGGPADLYIIPTNDREIIGLIRYFRLNNIDYIVIGNGSNLLVSDLGFRGAIIDLGKNDGTTYTMLGYEWQGEDMIIDAGAGCLMSFIGSLAAKEGASGFEGLSGIPGCVGGAIMMNAGAFDYEIKDIVVDVTAISPKGELVKLDRNEIDFRYRGSSLLDEGYILSRTTLRLHKSTSKEVTDKTNAIMEERKAKQPLEFPSAGSTFKRPIGNYAGKLISDAGLKGYSIGGAKVSDKHAGFIINNDNASAMDIYKLINYVRDKVREQFDIELEPEIRLIGDFDYE